MRSRAGFIADAYGLSGGDWEMVPVARGALGQIWRLSGGAGVWAVKELLFGCDEEQVAREAGLRDAAEGLGISAPPFLADRHGAHVSRLPRTMGGAYVKVYGWVDGSEADPRAPELLTWCGRTLALLHRAGQGTGETPDGWYERCPGAAEWAQVCEGVRRAGMPWAAALERFAATEAAELAAYVTPSGGGDTVTSHLDVRPQNVLVGPAGPALLDWDNAGPVSAERELARAVHVWAGGNDVRAEDARRLARGYAEAGGPGVIKGVESFSMLFATELNYVRVQAECAIDPEVTAEQREFASGQVVELLGRGRLPEVAAVSRLVEALTPVR
ncbi:phosphotransferase [Streptomyces brasiliscabiei]|uniref:phosphotransferase n=1 Tax=Streptomyces brasiliscabiei TaxID=2736302 RepID=UPI001C11BEE4|nr:phosphotransferase [Streptomyces brasiliscabiei]